MPVKPMLDGIELQQVQKIESDEDQVLTQHSVPALEGDFLQRLGRRATRVTLSGVMTGAEAGASLTTLRNKYREGVPVSFVADIATATKVDQVFIEELGIRELAGKPSRFEYELTLREMIAPPENIFETPPTPIEPPEVIDTELGTLVVEVIVEDEPDFDFSTVTVTADSAPENGTPLSRILTSRENNFWTERGMPPGQYIVRAVVTEPDAMSGQTAATISEGQTTEVQITLRRGVNIAKAFIIHFRFDSSFFEPCMREVLERVFTYAQAHPNEKIVIVGHTDKTGSDDYNQFLSERRARSVFGFMTFGTSQQLHDSAIADGDQLWRGPSGGLHDNWGVREYQYMLQDLEFYIGNIDEIHGNNTSAAVRAFQSDHGLTPTGFVNDATWKALITAYLEAGALALPEDRFLRNANPEINCDSGILKWLGCGEQDPVRNTEDAWRPNRRVEILFVHADKLPCKVPPPVTFNLPQPGAVNSNWCLGPGNVNKRCCFTTRPKPDEEPEPNKWQITPAEPDRVIVSGTIKFEDGSPLGNEEYVLIAPDGTFLHHDAKNKPDLGEVPKGDLRGRPIPMKTDGEGNFNHPESTPVGIYILQIPKLDEPAVARANDEPPQTAVGNVVCLHVESAKGKSNQTQAAQSGTATTGTTVHRTRPAPVPVDPIITSTTQFVIVKKPHTNPARVPITLRVSARFRRSGTLTRTVAGAGGNIRIFNAPHGGTEITFNGTDNVFTANSLNAGVHLFAESDSPSSAIGDVQLTLTLAAGPTAVGAPATIALTAVSLQLDVSEPRTAPASFQPLPQPPATPPAPGATANDKWFGGAVLNAQDTRNSQPRGQLLVAQVIPTAFAGELILRQVRVSGNNITGLDNKLQLFDDEIPGSGRTPPVAETPQPNPLEFNASTITSAAGRQFFIEGRSASTALRDTGFQLGIKDVENDGDRVALTVAVGAVITLVSSIVVVKKSYTNPARQQVTLQTTAPFNRTGTLTRSSNAIRFFTAASGGTEITFNGTDNVFSGQQLTAGVILFAEGASASPAVDDFQLTLTLATGGLPLAGSPVTVRMTSVELTLDVCVPRTSPGVDPAPLSTADKINVGRFIQVRNTDFSHQRAMLIVRRPNPLVAVTLLLAPINARASAFTNETPGANQSPLPDPHPILSGIIPPDGTRFFVEGNSLSAAARDTGYRLGIQGIENECDRVNLTAIDIAYTNNTAPFGTTINRAQIEGVLTTARSSFDVSDLFGSQPGSLFRVRVDAPGVAGNQIQARLISLDAAGTEIERIDLTLSRTTGDIFVSSLPLLAIPQLITRAQITFRAPQDIEVIRATAGGRLRVETLASIAGVATRQARVRGRVVRIKVNNLSTSGVSAAEANSAITLAQRTWAQAGIEIRQVGAINNLADPGGLNNIPQLPNNFSNDLGTDRRTLFNLNPTPDIDIYFVNNIQGAFGEGFGSNDLNAPMATFAGNMMVMRGTVGRNTMGHEMGHILLDLPRTVNGGGDEHSLFTVGGGGALTSGAAAPPSNVMGTGAAVTRTDLTADQCLRAFTNGFVNFVE